MNNFKIKSYSIKKSGDKSTILKNSLKPEILNTFKQTPKEEPKIIKSPSLNISSKLDPQGFLNIKEDNL